MLKFLLHTSKDEQTRRLLDRIDGADKNWKCSFGDFEERGFRDRDMACHEDMIRATAREHAPWHVVPANNKWEARMVVSSVLSEAPKQIDPHFPSVTDKQRKRIQAARETLSGEAEG